MEFTRPRRKRPLYPPSVASVAPRTAAPRERRVIAVFGLPGVGVTSMLRILADAVTTSLKVIIPNFDDLAARCQAVDGDIEAVLIDGFPHTGRFEDGAPFGPACVQYLYDRHLVYPSSGAIVRVEADPNRLIAQSRTTGPAVQQYRAGLEPLEERIRLLGLHNQYFTVHNEEGADGLIQAVSDLAQRARLR